MKSILTDLQGEFDAIAHARHHDPFKILGNQTFQQEQFIVIYSPGTRELSVTPDKIPATRVPESDFFIFNKDIKALDEHYLINKTDNYNNSISAYDPYSFKPLLSDYDLNLFCPP